MASVLYEPRGDQQVEPKKIIFFANKGLYLIETQQDYQPEGNFVQIDNEHDVQPGDQSPGAASVSLWPRACPGLSPLPSWLQPQLTSPPCTPTAGSAEQPKIHQISERAEPRGAAGAQEEDQQQGEKADAGLEHCHGCSEGGHGTVRLLTLLWLSLSHPPSRSSPGSKALQDLHLGPGQELHPPLGFISAGDAEAVG